MREQRTRSENIDRLEDAVRRLPRMQREVFLAVRLDAMSYAEIAERTGLSVQQVRRQFIKALRQLSDGLAGQPAQPWWQRVWQSFARRIW
jgi:RNA polymerase sigma factor (sigma-70 family)